MSRYSNGSRFQYSPGNPRFGYRGVTPAREEEKEYRNVSPRREGMGQHEWWLAGVQTPNRVEIEVEGDELLLPVKLGFESSVSVGVQYEEEGVGNSPAAAKMVEPSKPSLNPPTTPALLAPPTNASFSTQTPSPSPYSSSTSLDDEHVSIKKPPPLTPLGLRIDDHLTITLIHPNTPASQLTGKQGYTIVLANNRPARTSHELAEIWSNLREGDVLHLLIRPPLQADL